MTRTSFHHEQRRRLEQEDGVLEFLKRRSAYLAAAGIGSCEALVPKITGCVADYWTDGMWGKVKAKAERWSEIRFRIQTLRATFGQMCIDWGGRPDAVSRALRHKTTRTTELYYARIRPDHAFPEHPGALRSTV